MVNVEVISGAVSPRRLELTSGQVAFPFKRTKETAMVNKFAPHLWFNAQFLHYLVLP